MITAVIELMVEDDDLPEVMSLFPATFPVVSLLPDAIEAPLPMSYYDFNYELLADEHKCWYSHRHHGTYVVE